MTRWIQLARGVAAAGLLALCAAPLGAAPARVAGGIQFTFMDPNAKTVNWVGEHNGWNTSASPMTRGGDGTWSIVLPLPPGEHAYKFYVDGQWIADPSNPVTAGEFGNSIVKVGADGGLVAMAATSNTPYSPKIEMTGRVIGLYQVIRNRATDRFELSRPLLDIDLNFDTRFSDALSARWLMNVTSQREATDLLGTSLDLDRGSMLLTRPHLRVFAFDNEGVETWDPGTLSLVGNVGIYSHPFGLGRQGFALTTDRWGVSADLLYADNFDRGGTTYPPLVVVPESTTTLVPAEPSGSGYRLAAGARNKLWSISGNDLNEDVLALRLRRGLVPGLELGLQGRTDRGFNLGSIALAEVRSDSTFDLTLGPFEQQWYALGPELRWTSESRGLDVSAGYLHGLRRIVMVGGAYRWSFTVSEIDSIGATAGTVTDLAPALAEHRTLDTSNRFGVKGAWRAAHGDLAIRFGLEHEKHAYEIDADGIDNSMTLWTLGWDRDWKHYLGRPVRTRLDVEYSAFSYEPGTPWSHQLWFPTGNFWLESSEHLVRFDRLVMLGGDDAISIRPRLMVPIHAKRRGTFEYEGRINLSALDRVPKYAESLFRFGVDLTPSLRLSTDSRWVKYDVPALGLHDGYLSHFGELAYTFAPGIQLAASFGVDPWVIDEALNQYGPIGRDQFLFARGANGATAELNYLGLGSFLGARGLIESAERALADERRVQLRALMRF